MSDGGTFLYETSLFTKPNLLPPPPVDRIFNDLKQTTLNIGES